MLEEVQPYNEALFCPRILMFPSATDTSISQLRKIIPSLRRILNPNINPSLLNLFPIDLNPRRDAIPRLDRPNALRRSRHNQVPFLKCHHPTDIFQYPRHPKQHQIRVIILLRLPIHLQPDARIMRIRDLLLRDLLANGQEGVEALGDCPGESGLFGCFLDVATG